MRPPLALALCSVLLLLVTGEALSEDQKLLQLQKQVLDWHAEQNPFLRSSFGDKRSDHLLNDLSLDALDRSYSKVKTFLQRATMIDRAKLKDRTEKYNYDILMNMLKTYVADYNWKNYGPLNPINSLFLDWDFDNSWQIADATKFDSKKDAQNYIRRMNAWPVQLRQMKVRMNKAISLGTTNHNVSMEKVPDQILNIIGQNLSETYLYKQFIAKLGNLTISQKQKKHMKSRALAAISKVRKALLNMKKYIQETYMPNTRTTYGVHGLPKGTEYYAACLKWHVQTNVTPEEAHSIGLREVDRITDRMHKIMGRHGFANRSILDFYNMLKRDPRFSFSSKEQIKQNYTDIIFKRIFPKLPEYFNQIPGKDIVVMEDYIDGYYGSYGPGSPATFYVNLFRPNETKSFSMLALTLHETVPGHHLEMRHNITNLPDFRKEVSNQFQYTIPNAFPGYTIYREGWGLYAEYLGEEMQLYKDDYEMMGRYGEEMLRACRLVVDTGIHYYGWTRDKAIKYMDDRTANPLKELQNEVDRYITWPGQACAYKLGEQIVKDLRQQAETELGDRFNIRDFHSVLLDQGSVPPSVLQTVVNDYISRTKA